MRRWTQLESTDDSGITSRGTVSRLIRDALSTNEVVPVAQAIVKKLKGTRPQSTNAGKCRTELFAKILVRTNVITPIITRGFRRDQKIPSDIFRYRILKSFSISLGNTKLYSPVHIKESVLEKDFQYNTPPSYSFLLRSFAADINGIC